MKKTLSIAVLLAVLITAGVAKSLLPIARLLERGRIVEVSTPASELPAPEPQPDEPDPIGPPAPEPAAAPEPQPSKRKVAL